MPGYYMLTALLTDTTNIERIEFYLNGELIGTDYGTERRPAVGGSGVAPAVIRKADYGVVFAPRDQGYTYPTFVRQQHEIAVVVVTTSLADATFYRSVEVDHPIQVGLEILHPGPHANIGVSENTNMTVRIFAAQYPWRCGNKSVSTIYGLDCYDVAETVADMKVYVDDIPVAAPYLGWSQDLIYEVEVDVSPSDAGTHTLRVEVKDDDGVWHDVEQVYQVLDTTPQLSVTRSVTKQGTHFEVKVTMANDASAIYGVCIEELIESFEGFQAVGLETTIYDGVPSYDWSTDKGKMTFDLSKGSSSCLNIKPGYEYELIYQLVPVLTEEIGMARRIGQGGVRLRLVGESSERTFEVAPLVMTGWSADAIDEADYIIVTHPGRLSSKPGGGSSVDPVLAEMAHLAVVRGGVLGYLTTADDNTVLRDLVQPSGAWTQQLHPNFGWPNGGYMLIVGEEDVVPAWELTDPRVRLSDQPYSARIVPAGSRSWFIGKVPSLGGGRVI